MFRGLDGAGFLKFPFLVGGVRWMHRRSWHGTIADLFGYPLFIQVVCCQR